MFLIAIGGPSCAGKTQLAVLLASRLSAAILPLDAYYRELAHLPLAERAQFNFDMPDALDQDLLFQQVRQLSQGHTVDRPVYDFTTHSRAPQTERIQPGQFLILEGLFALYWEPLRALSGTKVFVDAPDPVCLARRQVRDVRERGRTPDSVLTQYDRTVRPMAEQYVRPTRFYADVVVSGETPIESSVAAVLAHIERSPLRAGSMAIAPNEPQAAR